VNDRKHFPTEMGGVTLPTSPSSQEREQFLAHCQQQGTSHKALHNMAPELIASSDSFGWKNFAKSAWKK